MSLNRERDVHAEPVQRGIGLRASFSLFPGNVRSRAVAGTIENNRSDPGKPKLHFGEKSYAEWGPPLEEGNAGMVWRTGKPKYVDDVVLAVCLPRSPDAKVARPQDGMWILIQGREAWLGVIELLETHYWTNTAPFPNELEKTGVAVG